MDWLLKEAEREPLMAVWEDLHWADPSTIELLGLVIERAGKTETPLLTLMTFRSDEFQPPWAALASTTEVVLGRLERPDVEEMIRRITNDRSLPLEVVDQIFERTDGLPLFVEELLQTVLDSGSVRTEGDHFVIARPSSPIAIPERLEDLVDVSIGSARCSQDDRATGCDPRTRVFTRPDAGGPRLRTRRTSIEATSKPLRCGGTLSVV